MILAALTDLAADPVQPWLAGPIVQSEWMKMAVLAAAYAVTLSLSGVIVRFFVLPRRLPAPPPCNPDGPRFDTGAIIGKCENIITLTLVLLGQETGLAVIFTGKSIVRSEDIKKNPGYYLGGTLVNLVWGLTVGMITRVLIRGL